MKTEISAPAAKPSVAAQGETVAAEKERAVSADSAKRKEVAQEMAAMQEVMRKALNIEPVPERELQIQFEKELHIYVVKVLDKDSGEVIRQIPIPEEISIAKGLRAAMRKMAGNQSGIAVDQEV